MSKLQSSNSFIMCCQLCLNVAEVCKELLAGNKKCDKIVFSEVGVVGTDGLRTHRPQSLRSVFLGKLLLMLPLREYLDKSAKVLLVGIHRVCNVVKGFIIDRTFPSWKKCKKKEQFYGKTCQTIPKQVAEQIYSWAVQRLISNPW